MRNLTYILSGILLIFFSVGCGDRDNDITEVVRLSFDDSLFQVGEASVIRAGVSFDEEDIFFDDDDVILIVRVPQEISLIRGTSEVQGTFDDEDIGAQVIGCDNDEFAIVFQLNDNDLRFADDPSGDSNAEISFTVSGDAPIENGIISAIAVNTVFFDVCEDSVLFDVEALFSVVEPVYGF